MAQIEVSEDFLKAAASFNDALKGLVGQPGAPAAQPEDNRPVLKVIMKVHILLKDPDGSCDIELPFGFKDPRALLTVHERALAMILSDGGLWRYLDEKGFKRNWVPMTRIKDADFELVIPEQSQVTPITDPAAIRELTKRRDAKAVQDSLKQAKGGLHVVEP